MFFIFLQCYFCEQITVAVASNFIKPMQKISTKFNGKLRLVFGSSGKLYSQIINGAPYDVFFSADQQKPQLLFDEKYTAYKPFTYATGRLALYTTNSLRHPVTKSAIFNVSSLAIANPLLAPYGKAALQVLDRLQLKYQNNKRLIIGENVSQVFAFVSSGNVEFGFLALSQVINKNNNDYWIVPYDYHKPIKQDAVILKSGNLSHSFTKYVKSKEIRLIIASYGYTWN